MKRQKNAQKERLDPKYHQYFYGPYSGMLGQTVIAASYLDDQWDRFVAWLEDRNIDPGPCGRWINEKLELLAVMKTVKRTHTGVADFSGYGAEASDIDWAWFNRSRAKKDPDTCIEPRFRVFIEDVLPDTCIEPRFKAFIEDVLSVEGKLPQEANADADRHCEYSTETSGLLAALFLVDSRNDFKAWLHEKDITDANAYGCMDWADQQAQLFRLLIGPDAEKTGE